MTAPATPDAPAATATGSPPKEETSTELQAQASNSESNTGSPADPDTDRRSPRAGSTPSASPSRSRDSSPAKSASGSGKSDSEPSAPPLPEEAAPVDDGWSSHWDPTHNVWYFYNRFTQQYQYENPRVPTAAPGIDAAPGTDAALEPVGPPPTGAPAGGYNPAIHGDYDPNAWYAQGHAQPEEGTSQEPLPDAGLLYVSGGHFNRQTGQFQTADQGPSRFGDDAKARHQMNSFFDVDAAASANNGRSLKAERSGKKPSKNELKAFKEKRRAKKEEKRRAWLLS